MRKTSTERSREWRTKQKTAPGQEQQIAVFVYVPASTHKIIEQVAAGTIDGTLRSAIIALADITASQSGTRS